MHAFEAFMSVTSEDVELLLSGHCALPWDEFLLNPRRLRGSDFLMRWSQGVWSEHRLMAAVNETGRWVAVPYGPSSVAPDDDPRAMELYFERLDAAGLGEVKRPDLLLFRKRDEARMRQAVDELGGEPELPFAREDNPHMREIVSAAVLAVECENSLWHAGRMPDYGSELRPMQRLDGRLGLPKKAVLPTVILKEEDVEPLSEWQSQNGVAIHIWHVFYDMAFGLSFDAARKLIRDGLIEPTTQVLQAPAGATTKKELYYIYYHYAYKLAVAREEPELVAEHITDANGHILPYVRFEGGRVELSEDAIRLLADAEAKAPA
jgi:hypothetical protein